MTHMLKSYRRALLAGVVALATMAAMLTAVAGPAEAAYTPQVTPPSPVVQVGHPTKILVQNLPPDRHARVVMDQIVTYQVRNRHGRLVTVHKVVHILVGRFLTGHGTQTATYKVPKYIIVHGKRIRVVTGRHVFRVVAAGHKRTFKQIVR